MGCRKDHDTGNCVCDIVKAIADAQSDVVENCCDVSCEKSIEDLLSPVAANDLDTVPFILFCEGDCKPFKGFGVRKDNSDLECFESFIFRVKSVDKDCCALLELLDTGDGNACKDPCDQFKGDVGTGDLTRTGICITVDLDCFCGISCLPAVSTMD